MPSTLTTFSTKSDPSPLPPIILIPGLGSSQLVSVPKTSCFEAMHLVWLNLPQLVKTLASSTLAECWISSLSLSPYDGDPRGFKTRPVHSLSSVSTLSPPGTLSNLVLANTNKVYADLISFLTTSLLYDPNVNLIGCAFDWRVSCRRMQERDDTFERLRKNLERAVKREGRPAVVITHSLGGIVFRAFLQYVEAEMEGKEEVRRCRGATQVPRGFTCILLLAHCALRYSLLCTTSLLATVHRFVTRYVHHFVARYCTLFPSLTPS